MHLSRARRQVVTRKTQFVGQFRLSSPNPRPAPAFSPTLNMKGTLYMRHKTTHQFLTAAAGFLLPALVFGQSFDPRIRADFFAGFNGDAKAMERGLSAAEEIIRGGSPLAAEALAWHGSGLLSQAGEKFAHNDFEAGGALWEKALAEMDEAGKRQPDNPAVLIPRAATWFAASRLSPPTMGKPILKKALADYEHVYDLQRVFFDRLDGHMRGELLFGLADGYARDGNQEKARFYFEKLAAVGTESGHLEQAQHYLNGEKYTVTGVGCVGCHVKP